MDKETIDSIRLIAVFDGWEPCVTKQGNESQNWVNKSHTAQWSNFKLQEMKYYKSWDWFMPAYKTFWDKLEEYRKANVHPNGACKGDVLELEVHCAVREFKLMEAFNALAECVKWYNSVKGKEEGNG